MRFAWIDEHRKSIKDEYKVGLAPLCRILDGTRQGFFAWKKRKPGQRQKRKVEIVKQIQQAYAVGRKTYGSPRVHRALKANNVKINEKTVAKYMKEVGLAADPPTPFRPQTTDSGHEHPIADNKLDRQFEQKAPDEGYVADITYIPTAQGFVYLAMVMDLFSRRIVGHAVGDSLKSALAIDALDQALQSRKPASGSWRGQGLLFHSDRGVQYASDAFRAVLEANGIDRSMSRTGNCYDNAVAESFFATLKRELVNRRDFATLEEARQVIFEYIEVFYNRQRLHSTLGYLSPEAFETQHVACAA